MFSFSQNQLLHPKFKEMLVIEYMYIFSSNQNFIDHDDFPDINLCPYPAFDQNNLKKHGYPHSFGYSQGINSSRNLFGWNGVSQNASIVLDEISTIKSVKDCPFTRLWVTEDNFKEEKIILKFDLTRVYDPNGRCCKAILPSTLKSSSKLSGITFRLDAT